MRIIMNRFLNHTVDKYGTNGVSLGSLVIQRQTVVRSAFCGTPKDI